MSNQKENLDYVFLFLYNIFFLKKQFSFTWFFFHTHKAHMKITKSQNTRLLLKNVPPDGRESATLLKASASSQTLRAKHIYWLLTGWRGCDRALENIFCCEIYLHTLHLRAAGAVGMTQKWKLKVEVVSSYITKSFISQGSPVGSLLGRRGPGLLHSLSWRFLNETETIIAAETARVRSRRPPSGCMSHLKIWRPGCKQTTWETHLRSCSRTNGGPRQTIVPEIHMWVLLLTGSAKMEGI